MELKVLRFYLMGLWEAKEPVGLGFWKGMKCPEQTQRHWNSSSWVRRAPVGSDTINNS